MATAQKTIERRSEATWEGDLPGGRGTMKVGKGAYEGPFSFASRFEQGKGTNPEELLGAAHAGCFSMAFSHVLASEGHSPQRVNTQATVHLRKTGDGFEISKIDLVTRASVPGISPERFDELAEKAKATCPVSKLFAGAEITLDATLE